VSRILVSFLTLSLALPVAGCDGQVYEGATYDGPACVDADGTEHGYRMLLTGADSWGSTTPVIDDGDLCRNAEHSATAQDLLNKITYLANTLPGVGDTVIQEVELSAGVQLGTDTHWWWGNNGNATGSSGGLSWVQTNVGGARALAFSIRVPPRGTIKAFRARLRGNVGSGTFHSALPATMPVLQLLRSPANGSAFAIVDTITDASANVAAYDGAHNLEKTLSSPHTIVAGDTYYLRLLGETGSDSLASALAIFGATVTFGRA
jgi:hypothetical protein